MKTILAAAALAVLACPVRAQEPGYAVSKKISVPADAGWDYLTVDETARRVYVTHGEQVQVLDADSFELKGAVTGLGGVHGIALAQGKGFISDGKTGTVDVFDPITLQVTDRVKAGANPDALIYDPGSRRVFAFNGKSQDATAIDAKTLKASPPVRLGGKPEFAAADGKGSVFVDIEDKNELLRLDSKKLKIAKRWKLPGCVEPSALAIDAEHGRLFVGCHNKVMDAVAAASGKIVASWPIGEHVDAASYDPQTKLVFASCGDGTVTIAREESPDKYAVVQTARTQTSARTHALDLKTHRLFLSAAEYDALPPNPAMATPGRPPLKPGSFAVLVLSPSGS